MTGFATILNAVLPLFGIAALGLLMRKANWLTEEADHSLLRININVLLPCLIFDSTLGNPALLNVGNLLLAPLIGVLTFALGAGIATLATGVLGIEEQKSRRTFALSVGMYNYGYVPLPLSMLLFDNKTTGVLLVHNVGVETALWTLGLAILRGGGFPRDLRKLINAPLIAILLSIFLNALHLDAMVPTAARSGIQWLGQCAIPMALILIGAIIADHLPMLRGSPGLPVMAGSVVLRLGIVPVLFLLIARFLPCSTELKRVIVLQAAMPAAVFPIIMAKHFGGDPVTALRVVITTSIAGLVTIPLWIEAGLRFCQLR